MINNPIMLKVATAIREASETPAYVVKYNPMYDYLEVWDMNDVILWTHDYKIAMDCCEQFNYEYIACKVINVIREETS